MENQNVADISVLESIQNQANTAMGCQPVSGMAVFNEFTKESDSKMVESLSDYLEKLRKGKPARMEQEDYDRQLTWTEGVYEACKKRLDADDYE
jgi:hypothetical protein